MVGGVILTSIGLVLVAATAGTSYALIGVAAGVVYVGLNATATAHRAVIVEGFEDARGRPPRARRRSRCCSAGSSGWASAGSSSMSRRRLALRGRGRADPSHRDPDRPPPSPARASLHTGAGTEREARASFRRALRHSGAREVLLAQVLWVGGYIALPTFFVLYAEHVLDLSAGAAAGMLVAFGALTGIAMLLGGRVQPARVFPLLMLGAALLGGGLVAASMATSLVVLAIPFACAAVGAGLVTALGFPYFARFIPVGESGSYSGLYFSVRAVAATVAVPLAGVDRADRFLPGPDGAGCVCAARAGAARSRARQ